MVTEPARKAEEGAAEGTPEETGYALDGEIPRDVVEALDGGQTERVRELVRSLHYADAADLLERLDHDRRLSLVDILGDELAPEILSELDETVRDEIIEHLGVEEVAAKVSELETDDAVDIIEEMDKEDQQQVLDAIPDSERALIEEALTYPEDSAGRLMQRELVAVPSSWTVGQTIDFMRESAERETNELPEVFYNIFVVDPKYHPVGEVPLSRLLRTRRPVLVTEIMNPDMTLIPVTMDQEDVAFLFRQRDLVSAPVVDEDGRLAGAITIDDVVDVIHEENEEDLMYLGGVREDDLYSAAVDTTRSRFAWLLVNLATAILASVVISFFEATIQQMVALAVLMPIVASMGGNAGTQSLTVAVRALAMRELNPTNAIRVIGKEVLVGGFNGILFAVLTGLVAWAWFDDPAIGVIIGLAMIINMIVAALAGTLVPLLLERAGIDPAVASSVFVTMMTDVVGFFSFLGLGAWLLL